MWRAVSEVATTGPRSVFMKKGLVVVVVVTKLLPVCAHSAWHHILRTRI